MTSAPDGAGSAARAVSAPAKQMKAPLRNAAAVKTVLVRAENFMVSAYHHLDVATSMRPLPLASNAQHRSQRPAPRIAGERDRTIAMPASWPAGEEPAGVWRNRPGAAPPSPFGDALFFRVDDLNATVLA